MDRLPISSWVPAELAEVLSDQADLTLRFDCFCEEDVRACVPADLAEPIAMLLQCKGSTVECYEAARQKLENAMEARFANI